MTSQTSARQAPRILPTIEEPVRSEPGAQRYGGRPKWSPRELQVLRERYPDGGALACAPLLPERTPMAITERAHKLGIYHNRRYIKAAPSNEILDAAIRKLYASGKPRHGKMAAFAAQWQRSRQWVRARAIQLGAAAPMGQFRPWTPAEEQVLLAEIDLSPRRLQMRLADQLGIDDRTDSAIAERVRLLRRRHELNRPLPDPDVYSGHELERLLGVDHRTITRWITGGRLTGRATRDAHGVIVRWEVRREALREFLITFPSAWHPGRCDRYWLVELLAGRVGEAR